MIFQSEVFLRALEQQGAQVDWPRERARIPRTLAQRLIDSEAQANPPPAAAAPLAFPRPGLPGVGMQVAQFVYDAALERGREPLREDLVRMIQFGDALHGDAGVGHALLMRDVPSPLEPLEAQALLIEHACTPQSAYYYYAEQLDYAAEISEIVCGDRKRFTGGGVFLTSPLRLCRRACNLTAKRIGMGFAAGAGTMPVAGASVPATLAGAIAVTAAEILGAWVGFRALREGVPLSAGIAAGAVDMRTGNVSFCSPEAMLLDFGVIEFFRQLCGKTLGVAGASDYCDSKTPGLRAALEKAHKTMIVTAFSGCHGAVGEGMLDSGKVLSPEQLLIERDVSESVRRLFAPIEVTAETLALEAILDVGQGLVKTHLTTDHTLLHYRQALWSPIYHDLVPRPDCRVDFAHDRRVVALAHAQYLEVLSRYRPPTVQTGTLKAVRAVVERAHRAMASWDLG
jgi:trimethylamine--corrinoid protein Co-methyltransferase